VASADKVAYVAAKHGIIGLTKVTALETANAGITANAICPGWVLDAVGAEEIRGAVPRRTARPSRQAKTELVREKQADARLHHA